MIQCICVWTFRAHRLASSSSALYSCAVILIRQKQNQNSIAARDHPKCSCVLITFLALIIFHYFTLWLPTLIFWFVLIPGTLMWCTLAHTSACIRSRSHTHNPRMHTLERTLARTHARPRMLECVRACVHARKNARTHVVARVPQGHTRYKRLTNTYAADNTEYRIKL